MEKSRLDEFHEVYRDLHRHPELSFQEHRTAGIVADRLTALGYTVTTGVGQTGVVGVLDRGAGATVMLRADMDALPVLEATGLPYASTVTATNANGLEVPVMHACGHDVHTTALLGAAEELAGDPSWAGKLILVFQPSEEIGKGAIAMIEDGLISRFGTPDVVLGQHVAPLPAGVIGLREGAAFAASDGLRITLHGRGGHGSRPETTVDTVVLAASVVMRLQTIVSREVAGTETAVVTVGMLRAGDAANIIPDSAVLELSIRTFDPDVRTRVLDAVTRIVNGEAETAGAPRKPEIEFIHSFPSVVNDAPAGDRVSAEFARVLPQVRVVDPGVVTGSEDVGMLAEAAGAPCVYWLLGGADPAKFAQAKTIDDLTKVVASLPSNHSPKFAPVIEPTLEIGINALATAARTWLAPAAH